MDRRNELTIRDLLARAEKHGWKYVGLDSDGYYVQRRLKNGRMVALYAHRPTMTISVSGN